MKSDLQHKIADRNSKFENSNGGEDRTRTCKRFPAVVFKTTALPVRLPFHEIFNVAGTLRFELRISILETEGFAN